MTANRSRPVTRRLDADTATRLRADLMSFFARRTRDRALAEDLAQQAVLQVVRGLPRFRGAAKLRTWARRIAANLWSDHVRRQAASRVEPASRATEEVAVTSAFEALGPTSPAHADEVHDRGATHDCLLTAVRELPVDARRIILLHEFGDMPLDQAAAALGCSEGAAKVRLHRARRRLAERCRAECVSELGSDGTLLCTPKKKGRREAAGKD